MSNSVGRISGRFFIVGASRSGTTLLQAILASHPRIFSFPESHFFCEAVPRARRYRLLGFAHPRFAPKAFRTLLERLERQDLAPLKPRLSPFMRSYGAAFRRVIDRATLEASKDAWVEKTPHHVDYVAEIRGSIPDARFIHLFRDGRDVVASGIEMSEKYAWRWGKRNLPWIVQRWNEDVRTSLPFQGQSGHLFVSYEALLDRPEEEIRRLCGFLGMPFDGAMLNHPQAYEQVTGWRQDLPWATMVRQPLKDTRLHKFAKLPPETQEYITANLLWGGQVRPIVEKA